MTPVGPRGPARVLVTGAAGYVGAHVVVALAQAGHRVIGVDNFAAGARDCVPRLRQLVGERFDFEIADVRDATRLAQVFSTHRPAAVVHLAALKSVPQSERAPIAYYEVNVHGLATLLATMQAQGVRTLVHASTACVYGQPQMLPTAERVRLAPINPYGRSKAVAEQLIADARRADPQLRVAVLRLFNPAGAHESGLIGQWPMGPAAATKLVPSAFSVALGASEHVDVHGADWPTHDGTAARDFVHVCDVADAHASALEALARGVKSFTVNIGSGRSVTVLQALRAFEAAARREIPYRLRDRRAGDVAEIFADASRARTLLGWVPRRSLEDMAVDAWRFFRLNPRGFRRSEATLP